MISYYNCTFKVNILKILQYIPHYLLKIYVCTIKTIKYRDQLSIPNYNTQKRFYLTKTFVFTKASFDLISKKLRSFDYGKIIQLLVGRVLKSSWWILK